MLNRDVTRRFLQRAHLLVPGLYAWLATVASPAAVRGASAPARASAFAALVALVVGPYLAVSRPRAGRAVGVVGFVGLSLLTWLLLGQALEIDRLEPFQAALGGLGWVAFAFGWGSLRDIGSVPEEHPNVLEGSPLAPRGQLPPGALPIVGASVLGALSCLLLAWRVDRADHALLAHATAIACAVALLVAGARVATSRGGERVPRSPKGRLSSASRSLAGLALVLAGGALWSML